MDDGNLYFRFKLTNGEITACAKLMCPGGAWFVGLAFCSPEDYKKPRKTRGKIGRAISSNRISMTIEAPGDIAAGTLRAEISKRLIAGEFLVGEYAGHNTGTTGRFYPWMHLAQFQLIKQAEEKAATPGRRGSQGAAATTT